MTLIDESTASGFGVLMPIAVIGIYVWTALALGAVFRKSGQPAWQAWVPIYNQVILFRLGGYSPWLLLLLLVPGPGTLAVWIVQIMACHRINQEFRVSAGMTVLAALLFPVWASVLGFGSARWVASARGDKTTPVAPGYARQSSIAHSSVDQPSVDQSSVDQSSSWAPTAPSAEQTPDEVPAPAASAPAGPPAESSPIESSPFLEAPETGDAIDWEETSAPQSSPTAPMSAMRFSDAPHSTLPPGTVRGRGGVVIHTGNGDDSAAAPPVTRTPPPPPASSREHEPWAPSDPDAFPETSGPVSAVAGAPDAGSPRSARTSVSAFHTRPEIPDEDLDETIIARRRRTNWSIILPTGDPVAIGSETVLLGRRPAADPAYPSAQLIAIDDGTVSKTHARLALRNDRWYITDLGSTNGVVFTMLVGTEVEAPSGEETEAGDYFLLGDAQVKLVRSDG
ncbi:DUF5684 domain-containing protein (plasmid) [Coraliomargarita sp. W4R53]